MKNSVTLFESFKTLVIRPPVCLLVKKFSDSRLIAVKISVLISRTVEVATFAITAIQTKDGTERRVFRGLIEKYQTFIMPGGIPGHYRISHMGLQTDEELRELAARIKEFEPAESI